VIAPASLLAAPLLLAGTLAAAATPPAAQVLPEEVVETPLPSGLEVIQKHYLQEIPRAALEERALRAVLIDLDPYSRYMDAVELQAFRDVTEAHFGGIGVILGFNDPSGYPDIQFLMLGGAAQAAGIRRGDLLLSIDGRDLHGMEQDAVGDSLRGAVDTTVRLQLRRAGQTPPVALELKRVQIDTPSVRPLRRDAAGNPDWWLDRQRRIGYLRVAALATDTTALVDRAVRELQRGRARGLVLDLRDCVGGLMDAALTTADLFVARGRLLTVRERGKEEPHDARPGKYTELPLVLLINHGTASSGEILAGAIADNGRARMVGERSFGKGRIQTFYALPGGRGGMVLSTGTFQRPNGHTIDKYDLPEAKRETEAGIAPDVEVKLSEAEHQAWLDFSEKSGGPLILAPEERQGAPPDPQLAKALELLPR